MKKTALMIAAAAFALPAAPAAADPPPWAPAYGKRAKDRDYRRYSDRDRYDRRAERRAERRYRERQLSRRDAVWRGRDGRYYCKRDDGTTGLVIGAGIGALAGSEIAGNGSRTLGAIIGAIGGGLLGREIDRGDLKCR